MTAVVQAVCNSRQLVRRASAPTGRHFTVVCSSQNVSSSYSSPSGSQIAVITGGNTGIGFESAKALLRQGYKVTLACRDEQKASAARQKLLQAVPGCAGVETLPLDLANLESVRAAAQRLLDQATPLDVLLNNAGVMATPQMQTADGFEYQLGVNHLGHFLLTNLLLPLLSAPDRPSRVVNVSSHAHYFGHMHFEDLMLQREGAYDPWKSYGQSKLANVLFSNELARRLPASANCTTAALHPGLVDTELARYMVPAQPAWWQKPLMGAARVFALTPEQGARTSVYCATSAELAGVTGKYFDKCRPVTSSKEAYDTEVARRLWERSAELVRL